MIRTRTDGNFLWEIFSKASFSQQAKLKEELTKKKLWDSFQRIQTKATKNNSFDAEIIGICVQCLITDQEIIKRYDIPDLTKLYIFWAEITGQKLVS